jgi:hypothetical protein
MKLSASWYFAALATLVACGAEAPSPTDGQPPGDAAFLDSALLQDTPAADAVDDAGVDATFAADAERDLLAADVDAEADATDAAMAPDPADAGEDVDAFAADAASDAAIATVDAAAAADADATPDAAAPPDAVVPSDVEAAADAVAPVDAAADSPAPPDVLDVADAAAPDDAEADVAVMDVGEPADVPELSDTPPEDVPAAPEDEVDTATAPDLGEESGGWQDVWPDLEDGAEDTADVKDVVAAEDGAEADLADALEDAETDVAWTADADENDVADVPPEAEVAQPPPTECQLLPAGSFTLCSADMAGQTTAKGALKLDVSGETPRYVCATKWDAADGYSFGNSAGWVADPQDCCGGSGAVYPLGPAPLTPYGYLGSPHAPEQIHPEELMDTYSGPMRTNPFTVVVTDASGGKKLADAYADWKTWAGSTQPHPGPDGTGSYFLHTSLKLIYVVLQDTDGNIILLVGTNLYMTYDGEHAGHPALGVCSPNGGTPVALLGGEIVGTTLNNDSGRFGHNTGVTEEALVNAAKIFNERGISITGVSFIP